MPRMALDWQEGGPNPSASPTASLAAILGQIPTGLTEPWPPPVLICALAVLLPSPLLLLLLQIDFVVLVQQTQNHIVLHQPMQDR